MGMPTNGSWRSAVGLGLLVPALAMSGSFTFENGASDARHEQVAALDRASLPVVPAPASSPIQVDRSSLDVPGPISPAGAGAGAAVARRAVPLIGLQAGHWRSSEAPRELRDLRYGGTVGGGKAEWEVTLEVAQHAARLLEERGYAVEILPATVPQRYSADLFISIHADGYNDPAVSGFTVGAPRRDATRRASEFVEVLAETYAEATSLRRRPNVPRRMRNYYAFNSRRYDHAIHPMTVGVIIETGFLTNPADRRVIVDNPDLSARGIVDAVVRFVPLPEEAPAPEGGVTAGAAR